MHSGPHWWLNKFRTDEPQILGATVQNLVAQAKWRPGFVHPCPKVATESGAIRSFDGWRLTWDEADK